MNIHIDINFDEYFRLVKRDDATPFVKLNEINSTNIDDHFFMVNNGGNVCIVRWGKSPINPQVRVPEFWKEADFRRALKNKFVRGRAKDGKIVKRSLADVWLTKADRYTFDGLVFESERNADSDNDEVNLWRGFGVPENPRGDWSLMQEHIGDVLADGDKSSADYMTRWMAWGFQNPTKPAEVAIALMSAEKGTGKGVLGRALCRAYGGHGIHLLQRAHLIGKFNAHFAMCGFLFSDEAIWPGYKEDEAVLKGLITEPTIQIERKGVDTYPMNNALKIMMASNSDRVVPVSENDRRYAVFKVSDKRKQDSAYFNAMQAQLDNGGLGAMLYDLRAMDLGGWHPRDDIPHTAALAGQKHHSLSPELKWLHGLLDSGSLPWTQIARNNETRAKTLFEEARRRPGLAHHHDSDFATFLKSWGCERKRNNGSVWVFPPLADMRARWMNDMPWSTPFDAGVSQWSASEFD